jgi:hypothetical protein
MTTQDTSDLPEVLATITASPMRRLFGLATLFVVGGVLSYIALITSPALHWRVFLLVLGGLVLWLADATRRATEQRIELTQQGIRSTSGEIIVPLDNIAAIKVGMFDLKPSNGFTVHLKKPRSRKWQPGLWWAFGRRVGIGGVTPGSEAKPMAQIIEALLADQSRTEG